MDTSALTLRFRIGSIPVAIEPWFWLTGILLGGNYVGPRIVLWLGVFFVSILVHELGHALAAQAFGAGARIRLYSFGGLTYPARPLSRWRNVAMTLAGPGAGFALGIAAFLFLRVSPFLTDTAHFTLQQLIWVNFGWGMMNLLPVPPLDGGHVLLGTLGRAHERTARIIGAVVAGLVAAWGLSTGSMYLGLMFGLLCWQNVQTVRAMQG